MHIMGIRYLLLLAVAIVMLLSVIILLTLSLREAYLGSIHPAGRTWLMPHPGSLRSQVTRYMTACHLDSYFGCSLNCTPGPSFSMLHAENRGPAWYMRLLWMCTVELGCVISYKSLIWWMCIRKNLWSTLPTSDSWRNSPLCHNAPVDMKWWVSLSWQLILPTFQLEED